MYENVYLDVAYTAYKLLSLIKVLANTPKVRDRLLFGSDFYMVQHDRTEREFSIDLRAALGEEDYGGLPWSIRGRFSKGAIQMREVS